MKDKTFCEMQKDAGEAWINFLTVLMRETRMLTFIDWLAGKLRK